MKNENKFHLIWNQKLSEEILSFDIDAFHNEVFVILKTSETLLYLDYGDAQLLKSKDKLIIKIKGTEYMTCFKSGSVAIFNITHFNYKPINQYTPLHLTSSFELSSSYLITGSFRSVVYFWPRNVFASSFETVKNITFPPGYNSEITNLKVFNKEKNLLVLSSSGQVFIYSFENDSYYLVHDFDHTIDMKIKDSLVDLISPSSILISSKLPFFVLHPSENVGLNSTDFYLINYTEFGKFNGIESIAKFNRRLNELRKKISAFNNSRNRTRKLPDNNQSKF